MGLHYFVEAFGPIPPRSVSSRSPSACYIKLHEPKSHTLNTVNHEPQNPKVIKLSCDVESKLINLQGGI